MAKRVLGLLNNGKKIWIVTPDVSLKSFALNLRQPGAFLDLFYAFGQFVPGLSANMKTFTLFGFNNKVVALKYFSEQANKQKIALLTHWAKKKGWVFNYQIHQEFLALVEGYLDTSHSLIDIMERKIDPETGKTFTKKIKSETWYKIQADLRNIFHHNQSPIVSVEGGKILFTFDQLPNNPLFFSESNRNSDGRYVVEFPEGVLAEEILQFLDQWAKNYLDLLDQTKEIDLITGLRPDGGCETEKATLRSLIGSIR